MRNYFEDNEKRYFAKMRPDAIIPTKRDENAGYDIYANFEQDYIVLEPHTTTPIPTGIAIAFSDNYYIQIEERSSTGKIGLKKNGGVMDSGYRGEYLVMLCNINTHPIVISKKAKEELGKTIDVDGREYDVSECVVYPYAKAIAQLIVLPVPKMHTEELSYEELKAIPSLRGDGRFGSSNK